MAVNVGIKTITFGEALDQVKNGHTDYMIRSKWLKSPDFINRIINLQNLKRYIKRDWCFVEGVPKVLRMVKKKKSGESVSKYAKIESDDILADDWVDMREWTVVNDGATYEKEIKRLNNYCNNGTQAECPLP